MSMPIRVCEYCKRYMSPSVQGLGKHGTFCKLECWFQASAEEYDAAHMALMAAEHPDPSAADALMAITAEIEARYPMHHDDCWDARCRRC